MSSSQNFTVYKNLPYNVYARAAGKWDYYQENQTFNSSQTVNINMQNYDGLSMTAQAPHNSAMPLDFSATVLPWKWDYYNILETNKYCFMPLGQYYYNIQELMINSSTFTVTAGVEFNGTVASNFANAQYIQLNNDFPSSFSTWETVIKFKFSNVSNYQTLFSIYNQKVILGTYQSKIKLWTNHVSGSSEEQGGITGLTTNTYYWAKLVWNGTIYTVYLSTTGAFAGEETTELTVTPDGEIQNYSNVLIGSSKNSWGATNASIDLSDTYIKIDNAVWWKGVDYLPVSYQGCTYNYIDDGSAVTLNAFVVDNDKSIVLTPDNSYTNGYLLGTVNIPAHTVYTYTSTTTAWTQPILSANGTIGGDSFACYSPSMQGSQYVYYAFDGNTSTYWRSWSAETTNNYLEFYNPDPLLVSNIAIRNAGNYYINDYEFQYSDDGYTWSIAVKGTNTNKTANSEWNFNVDVGSHKYWRIYAKQTGSVAISEMTITASTVTGTWTAV